MPKATYKRRPDGRYRIRYNGIEFYSTPWGPLSEAQSQVEEYKRQVALGLKEESLGVTFAQYAAQYIAVHKAECRRQTYNLYASYVNKAIDFFGPDARIKNITLTDIKALYNHMVDLGYGKYTLDKFSVLIKGIFRTAVNDGAIVRNPCAEAKKPKGLSVGTHRNITDEERTLVHNSVGTHPMGAAAMVMLYAGLRRGEAMTIDVKRDVDYEGLRISVNNSIRYDRNQPILSATKSEAGVRTIPLFDPLPDILRNKKGLLISNQKGQTVSKTVFRNQWRSYLNHLSVEVNGCQKRWYGKKKEHKKLIARGEQLPPWREIKFTPHDLRHSYVTMLYDAGVDIKTAVKWVGHADAKMIMEIYAHLTEQREKAAEMDARKHVENLLKGSKRGSDENKEHQSNET